MVILGFFLETDVEYSKQLGLPSNDLLFISEKMRIGKQENLVCNLNDKKKILSKIFKLQRAKTASFKKMKRMDLKKFLQAHE